MRNFKKLFASVTAVLMLATAFPTTVLGSTYASELEDAYNYSYEMGVTTMDSIDDANMYGSLTRIALAKMIAYWAQDVLGLTPDTSKDCEFADVSADLDADYDNGVTLACQMGLMGVSMTNFRPNDLVTRGEFGTTLSRAMWGDEYEGATPYYADHLTALNETTPPIMKDISNPGMTEYRGYVMVMMQRADEGGAAEGLGCTAEELLACVTASDYDACIAACSETVEEVVVTEDKSGTLDIELSNESPDSEVPATVSRVPFLVFDVEASEDVALYSATFEFEGYGSPSNLQDFAIYNAQNVKVSKPKTSMTNGKVTLSFISNVVAKDGGKETFTVTAKIVTGDNSTYGLSLTELNTSAEDINGLPVEGNSMRNVSVLNTSELTFASLSGNTETNITVGDEETLASFKLSNSEDVEDINVESVTIDVSTTNGAFTNLSLYADDEVVAEDLEIVNKQVVANIDYVIEKETNNVEFELRGVAQETASLVQFSIDADGILAKGDKYGFNVVVDGLADDTTLSKNMTIEGSDITVSFTKSDIDEEKPGADGVYIGTLNFTSNGNYTIEHLYIDAANDTGIINDLRLGSLSNDGYVTAKGYDFTDIDLVAGQKKSLALYMDIDSDAANGSGVLFSINLSTSKFTDTDNDVEYPTDAALNTILSTLNPLTTKEITVATASLDVKTTSLTNREVALGGDEYVLSYKARLDAGDAGDVSISKIILTNSGIIYNGTAGTSGADLLADVVSSATLEIDGKTYTTSRITTNKITFTNLSSKIVAGASNKDLKVSVQLKSVTNYTGDIQLYIVDGDITAKDGSETVTPTIENTISCSLNLKTQGTLTATFDDTESSSTTMNEFTKQPKYALAGADESVLLGKIKLVADIENVKITDIVLTGTDVSGNFETSIDTVYLLVGETQIAGTTVNAGGVTTITFDDLSIIVNTDTTKYVSVKATFKDINAKSAEAGAVDGGKIDNMYAVITSKGVSSSEDITDTTPVNANEVTVVANTIASIALETETLTAGTDVLVGRLIVTPTTQSWNVDDNGDAYNAYLKNLNLTSSSSALSGSYSLYIKRLNTTGSVNANLAPAEWLEIDGETVFEVYANTVVFDSSSRTPAITLKTTVPSTTFTAFSGGIVVSKLLANGVNTLVTATTK